MPVSFTRRRLAPHEHFAGVLAALSAELPARDSPTGHGPPPPVPLTRCEGPVSCRDRRRGQALGVLRGIRDQVLDQRVSGGDFVVRVRVDSELSVAETALGTTFVNERGGVSHGHATVVDARGSHVVSATRRIGDAIEIRTPRDALEAAEFAGRARGAPSDALAQRSGAAGCRAHPASSARPAAALRLADDRVEERSELLRALHVLRPLRGSLAARVASRTHQVILTPFVMLKPAGGQKAAAASRK